MSLSDRIQKDLVAAMKSKSATRVSVLRMLKTALRNKEIEARGELTAEQEHQVLNTLVKQRGESIESFEKAGREDRAAGEREERAILKEYLPEEVSLAEVERAVEAVVGELEATSPKDIGAVMKEVMARLKATGKTVDGKTVNGVVRRALTRA